MNPKVIRVGIKSVERGFLLATSPDHNGLYVMAKTRGEVLHEVPLVIASLLEAAGTDVDVHEAEPIDANTLCWIAIPKSLQLRKTA